MTKQQWRAKVRFQLIFKTLNAQKTAKQYLIEKWPARFEKTGLTQKELADKVGISRQSISEIMTGKSKNLRADTIEAIEEAFEDLGV